MLRLPLCFGNVGDVGVELAFSNDSLVASGNTEIFDYAFVGFANLVDFLASIWVCSADAIGDVGETKGLDPVVGGVEFGTFDRFVLSQLEALQRPNLFQVLLTLLIHEVVSSHVWAFEAVPSCFCLRLFIPLMIGALLVDIVGGSCTISRSRYGLFWNWWSLNSCRGLILHACVTVAILSESQARDRGEATRRH